MSITVHEPLSCGVGEINVNGVTSPSSSSSPLQSMKFTPFVMEIGLKKFAVHVYLHFLCE